MADANLLQLAIGNLLDNAFKYGDTVIVDISFDGIWNELKFCNDGTIPSSQTIEYLGTQKGRLDNVSDKPGSGIGLYVCNIIADAHEGTLSFEIQDTLFCATLKIKGEV